MRHQKLAARLIGGTVVEGRIGRERCVGRAMLPEKIGGGLAVEDEPGLNAGIVRRAGHGK